jgi:hypothetical protein
MTTVRLVDVEVSPGILRVDVADKSGYAYGQQTPVGPVVGGVWLGTGCVVVQFADDLLSGSRLIVDQSDDLPPSSSLLPNRVDFSSGDLFLEEAWSGGRELDVHLRSGSYRVAVANESTDHEVRVILFDHRAAD